MIEQAINRIIELATPFRETIGDLEYTDGQLRPIVPPRAEELGFATLQGLVDFITSPGEKFALPQTCIHIVSPWRVHFLSTLDPRYRDRECYALVSYDNAQIFHFGERMPAEQFVIAVQSRFVDGTEASPNDKKRLLELVGNMGSEQASNFSDDGVTQQVSVKAGVKLEARATIENPFRLVPHRTFPEVEQPKSAFIVRVHNVPNQAPHPAIYECDNGAWKLDAMLAIEGWLKQRFTEKGTEIRILA